MRDFLRMSLYSSFIFCIFPIKVYATKSPSADKASITKYKKECNVIKKFFVKGRYDVGCFTNYQHFNLSSSKTYYSNTVAKKKRIVRIATYNLLHPGSQRSIFKDMKLLAKVIDKSDIVIALELLPIVGRDSKVNKKVISSLPSRRIIRNNLFRAPGYLQILKHLRELDKSWALILSPRGDSAKKAQVEEFVGFYYRGRVVRPTVNDHCEDYKLRGSGRPVACIPNFRKKFMGRETTDVFSRRPFLASFESGSFDFSLLGSHLIYGSPSNKTQMKKILKSGLGVDHYSQLGAGATAKNYARLAEASVLFEFIEKLKYKYHEQDVILGADFNLNPENRFWNKLLSYLPGARLYQKNPTTIGLQKSSGNSIKKEGFSSSYDHFVFDPTELRECTNSNGRAKVGLINVYKGDVDKYIRKNYIIRKKGSLTKLSTSNKKIDIKMNKFKKYLKTFKTVKNGKIIWDDYQFKSRVRDYEKRLFKSQLIKSSYYKVYQEILSDHVPITLSCSTL